MSSNWIPEAEPPACPDDELLSFTMTNIETGEPMTLKYRPLKVLCREPYPGFLNEHALIGSDYE